MSDRTFVAVLARKAFVTRLGDVAQTQEADARIAGDNLNSTAISAEIAARLAAVTGEGSARLSGDASLLQQINLEIVARQAAMAQQDAQIGAIKLNEGGGPLTPAQIGMFATSNGAAAADMSNVATDTLALITGCYRPEQFGAAGDGVTDDTAALQAMADHIAARDAAGTITLALLTKRYAVSNTVFVRGGQRWLGATGANYVAGSPGAGITTSSATADVLSVRCAGPVHFDGFGITSSVTRTAGAHIVLDGNSLEGGPAPYSTGCSIFRCYLTNCWDGVRVRASTFWTMDSTMVLNFHGHGVFLSGEGWENVGASDYSSNGDDSTGGSVVRNCSIWDFTYNDSIACIRYACGGDFRVTGNKLLGSNLAVWMMLDRAQRSTPIATGTLIVTGNSMEQQRVGLVRIQQTNANSGNFGNVTCADNQMSIIGIPPGVSDAQFIFSVTEGTSGDANPTWVGNIAFNGNIINGMGAPSQPRSMVDFQSGQFVVCSDNVLNGFGVGNVAGVSFGADVLNGYCGPNVMNIGEGQPRYTCASGSIIFNDPQPQLVGQLPVAANDGSRAYVSDGLIGDNDALVSGGAGCSVVRQNGAWVPQQAAGMVRQTRFERGDAATQLAGSIGTTQVFGTTTDDDLQYRSDFGDHVFGMGGQEAGRFVRDMNGAAAGLSPPIHSNDPSMGSGYARGVLATRQSDGALRYFNPVSQAWQTVSAA